MLKAVLAAVLLCLLVTAGSAASHGFGIGGMFGEPTGLSAKLWLGRTTAIDAGAAWSVYGSGSPHLHLDFLHHLTDVIKPSTGSLPLYWGVGARLRFPSGGDDALIGARVPLGFEYFFAGIPIAAFVEVVPVLDFIPSFAPRLSGALGFRFYFG